MCGLPATGKVTIIYQSIFKIVIFKMKLKRNIFYTKTTIFKIYNNFLVIY
jgi:hypothetical protein